MAQISESDKREIQSMVSNFPATLQTAIDDWAKFKVGTNAGLFKIDDARYVVDWYRKFPEFWAIIRPNFDTVGNTGMISTHRDKIKQTADNFVKKLGADPVIQNGIGIAPIIIAGIIIGGLLGIAGAFWAVGYVTKQNNISDIIEQTVAGKLPPEILEEAIKEENESTNPVDTFLNVIKWSVAGFAFYMLSPMISDFLKPSKN